MENIELKTVCIENRTCYYFDNIIKIGDFNFHNILLAEILCENVLIFDILYKALIGAKSLAIRFDKMDGFIRVYDGTR